MRRTDQFFLLFLFTCSLNFFQLCNCSSHIPCVKNSSGGKNKVKRNPHGGSYTMSCSSFTTTYESFLPLVDRAYWIKASKDEGFQDRISVSMYRYYMVQHLYARLAQIRVAKGLGDDEDQKFAKHVYGVASCVPYSIFVYLYNLGDLQIAPSSGKDLEDSKYFEYSVLMWPNREGHFGRVDNTNHWKYMSMPAPMVMAQAIQEDLLFTQNSSGSPYWDLKPDIRPFSNDFHPGLPTANLLGWAPATPLTHSQRHILHASGITENNFDVIYSRYMFNSKLLEILHAYFKASRQITMNIRSFYEDKLQHFGGREQLGWLERDLEVDVPFSRSISYVERNVRGKLHPLQAKSADNVEFSLILGLRVRKYTGPVNDWAVYDWENYRRVPDSWITTRNSVFEFGDLQGINGTDISVSQERDGIRMRFVDKSFNHLNYPGGD
ncbi:uncharacterized protein [Fopius arisanus]|uniref:Uncharacterized protein n=1 Tax=Fopius arisanus TaxID=64838 RepID=A0A9R1U2C6_9HYME|nr:PREDICTED: uncharacterized protein LOC105267451 [Fopius arisanus]